jgi:hypothetical protein
MLKHSLAGTLHSDLAALQEQYGEHGYGIFLFTGA